MNYHAKRKEEYVALLGGECVKCGATERLEFDHVDPSEKSFSISVNNTMARAKLLPELEKCQLLCYDCHKIKTRDEAQGCGTHSKYCRGCRCDACKKGHSDYEYERRWAKNNLKKLLTSDSSLS